MKKFILSMALVGITAGALAGCASDPQPSSSTTTTTTEETTSVPASSTTTTTSQ